jgi:two-component system, cell cycle sensor histidine kinase and response regulator CckA
LVITDQTLSGLTSFDLASEIHQIRSEDPIILCSGYKDQTTPGNLRQSGIHLMLQKPLSRQKLAAAIA